MVQFSQELKVQLFYFSAKLKFHTTKNPHRAGWGNIYERKYLCSKEHGREKCTSFKKNY